jgi:hypothetical protein
MSPEKLLNKPSADKLYFGKYGGFTNIPLEYAVVDGRYIFRIEKDKYIPLSRVSAAQWKEIQKLVVSAGLPQLQLNEPGNMTYYIRIASDETDKEIKWTDQTKNPEVWQLFKELNSLIKPIEE